jgi:hypothetical protein
MIERSDIIDCKAYQRECCDFLYDAPDLDNIPPTGVVHVPLDQIEEFFKRIDGNGHRYIIISSCSDFGLALQSEHPPWRDMIKWIKMMIGPSLGYSGTSQPPRLDLAKCYIKDAYSVKCHSWTRATFSHIPSNVHHWFVTNLMTGNDSRLTAIPFGVAEGSVDILWNKMTQMLPFSERINEVFCSWQDYTYDRYELRSQLEEHGAAVTFPPDKPLPYDEYLEQLGKYRFVVSPPGNGEDCYRTMESIYMGAVVFVENSFLNNALALPTLLYESYDDLIELVYQKPFEKYHHLYNGETWNQAHLSYWKRRIEYKRAEIV